MVENNFDQRQLHWPNGLNIRDLGRLPTEHGKGTAMGRLVRADTLERLNQDGKAHLIAYGIRTIIDLRAPHELERSPPHLQTSLGTADISIGRSKSFTLTSVRKLGRPKIGGRSIASSSTIIPICLPPSCARY